MSGPPQPLRPPKATQTPRRATVLMGDINGVLGDDAVVTIPRRGWMLQRYEDTPVTISF